MANAGEPVGGDAWLVRVKLPWMKVDGYRYSLAGSQTDPNTCIEERKQPQAGAASDGEIRSARQPERRKREFRDRSRSGSEEEGRAGRIGNAVSIVRNRKKLES
jgi:hypothetical protein